MNEGEMENFSAQPFLDCANELVRSDEIERALWLLDNLPAYYRDFPPKEVLDLKREILKRVATPQSYAANIADLLIDPETSNGMADSPRGRMLLEEVNALNLAGQAPHIVDYGPGEYWLPMMLKKEGLEFTYQALYLSENAFRRALPYFVEHFVKGSGPKIFVACEIIEHLWQEQELKTEMLKACGLADIIHISTPKYTFDGHCPKDWQNYSHRETLGHLRAYTPNEFVNKINQMFPEYAWDFTDGRIMHMRLKLK